MLKGNKKSFPWLIVIVVAVVASLATVALLLLRARARKKRLQAIAGASDGTCMSFDCCPDEDAVEDDFSVEDAVEE